jgi:hypothetical protein
MSERGQAASRRESALAYGMPQTTDWFASAACRQHRRQLMDVPDILGSLVNPRLSMGLNANGQCTPP